MPGFCPCLDSVHVWILPMPGFCPCPDSAYACILPMPGFRLCLDSAHAWILLSESGTENQLSKVKVKIKVISDI
jgi:hypothetical protein